MPPMPTTATHPYTETFHDEQISDPYHWLEEDSEATKAWTAAQNAYTTATLAQLPGQTALRERLAALLEIGIVGGAKPRGGKLFFIRRTGSQNQPVIYLDDGEQEQVILDPNERSATGIIALDWWYPSSDGSRIAYGLSASGNERSTLAIREVATQTDLPDQIPDCRFASLAWLPDSSGFYYTRLPALGAVPAGEENYNRRVFFHQIGTDPATDPLIFGEGGAPEIMYGVDLSPDGRWLLVTAAEGWAKTALYLRDLRDPAAAFVPIVTGRDAIYHGKICNDALYLLTNDEAPNFRIMRVDPTNPNRDQWREIIAEDEQALQTCHVCHDHLALLYLHNATAELRISSTTGGEYTVVPLPAPGSIHSLDSDKATNTLYFTYTSFFAPPQIWHYAIESQQATLMKQPASAPATSDLLTEQVWYASTDGTQVPMFIVRRRDLPRDGARPTILTGYGGFNIALTPNFNAPYLDWVQRGGIIAQPSLRGGSEFGEAWHRAGMLENKQQVFDDFITAGEWLIREGWTTSPHLGIYGRSNGGLLVGATLTQRPDLCRAVLCGVPLLDMLRYHHFLMARLWIPEYGSADDREQFGWLRAYSPYHHVVPGTAYPAVLFTAAESDSRVHPLHARKMTALLQAETSSDPATHPVLLRLETDAGHGAGKPYGKLLDELVDTWGFLGWQLALP